VGKNLNGILKKMEVDFDCDKKMLRLLANDERETSFRELLVVKNFSKNAERNCRKSRRIFMLAKTIHLNQITFFDFLI